MRKVDPALGVLFNDGGVLGNVFGSRHVLLVPPKVQVSWGQPISGPSAGGEDIPYVQYPIPRKWQDELPPLQLHKDEIALLLVGRDDLDALRSVEWKTEATVDTRGLLEEFLRLADGKSDQESAERVRAFAQKWGPLWRCRTPGHDVFCHCSWTLPSIGWQLATPCWWIPLEEVREFEACAYEVRRVLELASSLHKPLDDIAQKTVQKELQAWVNTYLVFMGGPTLSLMWNDDPSPALNVRTGLGFLRIVWMHIAQHLCHGRGIAQCSDPGCGAFYFPKRKPRTKDNNYCEQCREGGRASKRAYSRKKRARG